MFCSSESYRYVLAGIPNPENIEACALTRLLMVRTLPPIRTSRRLRGRGVHCFRSGYRVASAASPRNRKATAYKSVRHQSPVSRLSLATGNRKRHRNVASDMNYSPPSGAQQKAGNVRKLTAREMASSTTTGGAETKRFRMVQIASYRSVPHSIQETGILNPLMRKSDKEPHARWRTPE